MDNKTSLRALPINAYARKFVFIFMTICSLFLYSNVFAATPETSKGSDTFFGTETVRNILTKLNISITDDNYLLNMTNTINNAFNTFYSGDNTIKAYNFIFSKEGSYLYMTPGNGTYSDTLKYNLIGYHNVIGSKSSIAVFEGWKYDSNGIINGYNQSSPQTARITISNAQLVIIQTNVTIPYSANDYISGDKLMYIEYLVSPYNTYTVASNASQGYGYYFLVNSFEFTEAEEESGDTSGDTSGDSTEIEERLDKISNDLGRIEDKIPTSGDIQQATTAGITSGLTNYFGGSGDANFEDKQYTSGEILEKIDFKPIENPNANFWLELTNILNNALTGSGGQVVFKWFGNEYTITPTQIVPPYPSELQILLTTVSTVVVILIIAKWIKIIADTSQEGNLDQLLEMNEEGIINLF